MDVPGNARFLRLRTKGRAMSVEIGANKSQRAIQSFLAKDGKRRDERVQVLDPVDSSDEHNHWAGLNGGKGVLEEFGAR